MYYLRLDFILVYKASSDSDSDSKTLRNSFETNLKEIGVELELQDKEVLQSC